MCDFEQKVVNGLVSCGVKNLADVKLGVAVSGGADSVSLLVALTKTVPLSNLQVITLNHNIREEKETSGDAAFVVELCKKLKVSCTLIEIPKGQVTLAAQTRGQGIEEAARFLRYGLFEGFIQENKLDYLCLAHNKNDQLETLLMRFLSGSSLEAAAGIPLVRGNYIRPLLNITRAEIEEYLTAGGFTWRTDSSNTDTAYFRNNIRHNLMPLLNENFPGWNNSVLSAAERFALDSEVLETQLNSFFETSAKSESEQILLSYDDFFAQLPAVQNRILLRACSLMGETQRIPGAFLNDFITHPSGKKVFHNVEILVKNNTILVKKYVKTHTESVFSAIIEEDGIYNFPFGILIVSSTSDCKKADLVFNNEEPVCNVELPCCIRSAKCGDEIQSADGKMKKVSEVFSDWHVPVELRCNIPVIQKLSGKKQEIVGIFGRVCGFNNWIVYEKVNR